MGVRCLLAVRMSTWMGVEALTSFQRPGCASKKQKKTTGDPTESFHSKWETYNRMPSSFQVACWQPAVILFLNCNLDQMNPASRSHCPHRLTRNQVGKKNGGRHLVRPPSAPNGGLLSTCKSTATRALFDSCPHRWLVFERNFGLTSLAEPRLDPIAFW